MMDIYKASCGSKDFPYNCQTCSKGYHTKQALVQHLKFHHPPASEKERTCPDCKVVFNLVKTMREHRATHRGPFPCPVEDCPAVFSLPKHRNHHLREKHGFDARRYETFGTIYCLWLLASINQSIVVFVAGCLFQLPLDLFIE